MPEFDKIVVITKKTALEELLERYTTRQTAAFYVARRAAAFAAPTPMPADASPARVGQASRLSGGASVATGSPPVSAPSDASFADYQAAHDAYVSALDTLKAALPDTPRTQFVERSFLPNLVFGEGDLVVTLGPDGLVVNTAKYLTTQPILALNPDPQRVDGVLIPFRAECAAQALRAVLRGGFHVSRISMAKAELDDGQALYAVNDLFIGRRTHVSARYRLHFRGRVEDQSSSGIIVSTGAGSTGWFRSILAGAAGVVESFLGHGDYTPARESYRFDWEAQHLYFAVREPFTSKVSSAGLVFERIEPGERLEVLSQMPQDGVIFSDGLEADRLEFSSGATARIGLAERKVHLISALAA